MPFAKHLRVAAPISTLILLVTNVLPAHADVGDETTYYLLTDHLGSVDVVLDEQGDVVERRDYLPYGAERENETGSGSAETDYKFTGKELDDETELYYYGARYYDPLISRFVSIDPLVLDEASSGTELASILDSPQLLNAYSYVANNPVNRVDYTGEEEHILVMGVVASLAISYQYAERAGNGLGFIYEVYVTEDYEQAMAYAQAYDQNSRDVGSITFISVKTIANEIVPFTGDVLESIATEDDFAESYNLEDSILNPSQPEGNAVGTVNQEVTNQTPEIPEQEEDIDNNNINNEEDN